MKFTPTVIFEDDQLLVLAKPAGMVVNRAETVAELTLQDWVEKYLEISNREYQIENEEDRVFLQRSGIAHRLDKETSGVMVVGKTPESLKNLMSQFKNRETRKEYLALVHGVIEPQKGVINLPIGRSVKNRHRFCVDVFGKAAVTRYQVEEVFSDLCLVRLFPKTGRTHQIRVHMAHLGHPLVGDEVYGGRKRSIKDRVWCPRHFLHAAVLEVMHPVSGEQMRFEAPLPDDLATAFNQVKQGNLEI